MFVDENGNGGRTNTIKEKIVGYPNFNNKGIKVFPKEKDG